MLDIQKIFQYKKKKMEIIMIRREHYISPVREFEAFKGIDNLSQKILITNDELDYSTSVVRHIKLKDFLRMQDLTV